LTGHNGHLFCQKFVLDQQTLGVGRAIAWLRENFDQPLRVRHLARLSDMSTSSLHHKFKAVTTVGPLQYQKQLRLQEARRLLLGGTADATTVALRVGYESPSQFSREYRRLFGLPPVKDARSLRGNAAQVVSA
jgi:transcriptional regulator GlxA family with amidase domain